MSESGKDDPKAPAESTRTHAMGRLKATDYQPAAPSPWDNSMEFRIPAAAVADNKAEEAAKKKAAPPIGRPSKPTVVARPAIRPPAVRPAPAKKIAAARPQPAVSVSPRPQPAAPAQPTPSPAPALPPQAAKATPAQPKKKKKRKRKLKRKSRRLPGAPTAQAPQPTEPAAEIGVRPLIRSANLKRVPKKAAARKRRPPVDAQALVLQKDAAAPEAPATYLPPPSQAAALPPQPAVMGPKSTIGPQSTPHAIKKPHTFLRGMAILAMLVLFEAFAVPEVTMDLQLLAPWELVRLPSTLTFLSAVFFGVLLLFVAIPMPYLLRTILMTGAGGTLLAFGLWRMEDTVAGFAFRGHPVMELVFVDAPGTQAVLLVSLLFPVALYWRSRYTASFWSRIAVLVGILTVAAVAIFSARAGGMSGSPAVVELMGVAVSGDSLMANRISAAILLVPLAIVFCSLLVFLRHPRTGLAGLWGWLYVTAFAAVPIVQACFVSSWRSGGWKAALEPLEAALFLYAGLLLFPVALGHLIGEVGRLFGLRRFMRSRGARRT